MLIYIILTFVAIAAMFLVFVATRPAGFVISRTAVFSAPVPAVFEQINSFRNWNEWSPWEKRDPNLKRTYEGPEAGEGASYGWEGNNQVGSGRMTITESRPGELIRIRLEFLKPFKATNTALFVFQGDGDRTTLTWSMEGRRDFMGKLMGTLMNMDKMIGGDFEKGLAGIRTIVERGNS